MPLAESGKVNRAKTLDLLSRAFYLATTVDPPVKLFGVTPNNGSHTSGPDPLRWSRAHSRSFYPGFFHGLVALLRIEWGALNHNGRVLFLALKFQFPKQHVARPPGIDSALGEIQRSGGAQMNCLGLSGSSLRCAGKRTHK